MQKILKKCKKNGNRVWSMFLALLMIVSLCNGLGVMEVKAEGTPIAFSSLQVGDILYPGDRIQLPNHKSCNQKEWAYVNFGVSNFVSCSSIITVPANSEGNKGWKLVTVSDNPEGAWPCCTIQGLENPTPEMSASVDDVTFSCKTGEKIFEKAINVSITNGFFDDSTYGEVSNYVLNAPIGLKIASVSQAVYDKGTTAVTLKISGTATELSSDVISVTIKKEAIKNGTKDLITAVNANAKWDITQEVVAKYKATVTGGTGGGEYEKDATVTITADAAPAGKQFKGWTTTDGVTFADSKSATTTFTMPEKAVTVTATYEDTTNKGNVTKDEPKIGEGAPDTTMNNSVEDLKNKVLTDAEKALVTGGEDAKVYIEVKDASSTVSAADKEKVEAALGSNTLGIYLDVSLWVKVGNNDAHKVTDPSGTISVSIKIPDNLINKDAAVTRTYKIVRVHNGVPTVIEGTYDAATGYFTFETDAFSTYALSYSDKTLDNNSGNNNNTPQNTTQTVAQNTTQSAAQTAPKTGDNTPILPLALLLLCMGLINIGVIYKKRYKTTGR